MILDVKKIEEEVFKDLMIQDYLVRHPDLETQLVLQRVRLLTIEQVIVLIKTAEIDETKRKK